MPLIPVLGRQKQVDLCEFEAVLDYTEHIPGQPGLHREVLFQKPDGKTVMPSRGAVGRGECSWCPAEPNAEWGLVGRRLVSSSRKTGTAQQAGRESAMPRVLGQGLPLLPFSFFLLFPLQFCLAARMHAGVYFVCLFNCM